MVSIINARTSKPRILGKTIGLLKGGLTDTLPPAFIQKIAWSVRPLFVRQLKFCVGLHLRGGGHFFKELAENWPKMENAHNLLRKHFLL